MTHARIERRRFLKVATQTLLAAPAISAMSRVALAQQPAESPHPVQAGAQSGAQPATHAATAKSAAKPGVTLNVRDVEFGAKGDGKTKDTLAIQQAIERCSVLGGGEVAVPADDVVVGWLREGTASLCDALESAQPGAPCWTWWGQPATAGAVARHQVQEIAVHGWDAEAVLASPSPLRGDVADDGVGEFLEIVLGPSADALPGAVTLRATDSGGSWRVTGGGPGRRHAEVSGTASDLVLMLYRRLPVSDCIVEGDPLLVASLLALANTT